jgi:NAD(P)-dependent dehydrogenase (short-subunit alcohol dehydrogenase family)
MQNKTIAITGATSGIGKAIAFFLAKAGANLILLSKNQKKGEKICNLIKHKSQTENVKFYKVDLSLMKEVKTVAETIKGNFEKIDILINNAGGRFIDHNISEEGLEQTLAVNYLSHFLLTDLLLDRLTQSNPGMIINLSSSTHYSSKGIIKNIGSKFDYNGNKQYSDSKLAIVLYTYKLVDELKNTNVIVFAVDPGGAATNFAKNNGYYYWIKHIIYYFIKGELTGPRKCAQNILNIASMPNKKDLHGKYFYKEKEKNTSVLSYDKSLQDKLWVISHELIDKY